MEVERSSNFELNSKPQEVPQVIFSKRALLLQDPVAVNPTVIGKFLSDHGMEDETISNMTVYIDGFDPKIDGSYRAPKGKDKRHGITLNTGRTKNSLFEYGKEIEESFYHEARHALDFATDIEARIVHTNYQKDAKWINPFITFLSGYTITLFDTHLHNDISSLSILFMYMTMIAGYTRKQLYLNNKFEKGARSFSNEQLEEREAGQIIRIYHPYMQEME